MIESTFIHVPGVGKKTERRLWREGYTSWELFREEYRGGRRSAILPFLHREEVLSRLPKGELWRLYPVLRDRTAFVDIETMGFSHEVTCIGLYDGCKVRTFVQGRDLELFPEVVRRYRLLVTFNGSQFDLPILQRRFPQLYFEEWLHLDLRFALRRLGLRGGLKSIERQLGLDRGGVDGLEGWSAVVLWRLHRRGHRSACETLERYCLEDVVNLEPLVCHLYNERLARTPLQRPVLEPLPRPFIPLEPDPELVDWLLYGAGSY